MDNVKGNRMYDLSMSEEMSKGRNPKISIDRNTMKHEKSMFGHALCIVNNSSSLLDLSFYLKTVDRTFTFSFWIRHSCREKVITFPQFDFGCDVNNTKSALGLLKFESKTFTFPLIVSLWYHLSISIDRGSTHVYVDGQTQKLWVKDDSFYTPESTFEVKVHPDTCIDELVVSPVVRDKRYIRQLYLLYVNSSEHRNWHHLNAYDFTADIQSNYTPYPQVAKEVYIFY